MWIRRALLVLGALAACVVAAAVVLVLHGRDLVLSPVSNPIQPLRVAPDSTLLARGEHISRFLCSSCHAAGDPEVLSGGSENFAALPDGPTLGVIVAPNLTRGGHIAHMSDGELARAIREGVGHDNRPLVVMPSYALHRLSDRDLAGVIAYLRRQPPVRRDVPARSLNLLGYAVLGTHMFPVSVQPPVTESAADPAAAPTAEYGAYTAEIADCAVCHGSGLRGGRKGQLPPIGPDLVAFAKAQPLEAFSGALREGRNPNGGALDPRRMPWITYAHLDDVETEAIWRYLRSR